MIAAKTLLAVRAGLLSSANRIRYWSLGDLFSGIFVIAEIVAFVISFNNVAV